MKQLMPFLLAAGAILGYTACKTAEASRPSDALVAPQAAVHGMVLFGNAPLYASHIPMFHPPHDWQALFEVTLSHPQVDAKALYLAQVNEGVQLLITLEPNPFVLPLLLNGPLKSFAANLYRGNFETGGELLLADVTVTVKRVLTSQPLSKDSKPLAALTYLLLPGDTDHAYMIHKIAAPVNFDHILQVKIRGGSLPSEQQPASVTLPALSDAELSRVKAGQVLTLTGSAKGWTASLKPAAAALQDGLVLTIVSDFFCTRGPNFMDACH